MKPDLLTILCITVCFLFGLSCQQHSPIETSIPIQAAFEIGSFGDLSDGGALTNAIADFDNDGDLDLFVGFRNRSNRLYRNDNGKSTGGQVRKPPKGRV